MLFFFRLDVLDKIWDVIESVSEGLGELESPVGKSSDSFSHVSYSILLPPPRRLAVAALAKCFSCTLTFVRSYSF